MATISIANLTEGDSSSAEQAIRTICEGCQSNCGMIACVKNGVITRIKGDPEHPTSQGRLCVKGSAFRELVYSPDRLKYPLMKTQEGFKRVSWDEALDLTANKLTEIRKRYGAESLVRSGGAPTSEVARRGFEQFLAAYGSPNVANPGHLCSVPHTIALQSVYGERTAPEFRNTGCMVIWGGNPPSSNYLVTLRALPERIDKAISQAKRRGAKLIVIDPICTDLAVMADKWLQINPGTDLALGLAMINVIIGSGLYDRELVNGWAIGFDKLREHVRHLTPEWAEEITGVSASDIKESATSYATTKPALIHEGNGLDQHTNVVQTVRAIGILTAITGNIDIPGGNVFFPPLPKLASHRELRPGTKRLSADKYPLYPGTSVPAVIDALLTGEPYQPRAMIVYHANPLLINASEKRIREALQRLDFLLVLDVFKSATAELAHIILPAASDLERFGFAMYRTIKGTFVALGQKVIEPIGESRSVFEVEYELAKRMGLEEFYPWKTSEEWVNHTLVPSGLSIERLRREPFVYTSPPVEYRKYVKEGFNTPSGKIELYSETLKKYGYDPLPVYKEPSDRQPGDWRAKYPLTGITRRPPMYIHTRYRNLPTLHKLQPDPLIRLHPDDAREIGIVEGEQAIVESLRGSISVKAKVTTETKRGVVVIDFGWGNPWDGGPNVNLLTDDIVRDPISSTTSNRCFACQVRKV